MTPKAVTLFIVFVALTLPGCAASTPPAPRSAAVVPPAQESAAKFPSTAAERVNVETGSPATPTGIAVFYGTDRNVTGDQQPEEYYGGLRGDETPSLGVCNVTIPPDHRVGEVERPFIASIPVVRRFSPSLEDPNKHVVIQGIAPLSRDDFLRQLRPRIAAARSREAFIFVHGFNTSFAKACRRTAQLANDLKAFEGIPLMYSWASVGSPSPRAYTADEGTIDWSVPHFEGFLGMVASETGATTVHLIAHSMGSRLVAATLESLSKKAAVPPQLGQLVFAAADMDAATFKSRYLPAFKSFPKRTTSYVSANDEALRLARQVALYARVGEAGRNILVTEGMDTIDVSPVDTTLLGHDYLATKAVFRDLFELLRHGTAPHERCGTPTCYLETVTSGNLRYWRLLKTD